MRLFICFTLLSLFQIGCGNKNASKPTGNPVVLAVNYSKGDSKIFQAKMDLEMEMNLAGQAVPVESNSIFNYTMKHYSARDINRGGGKPRKTQGKLGETQVKPRESQGKPRVNLGKTLGKPGKSQEKPGGNAREAWKTWGTPGQTWKNQT